MDILTVVDVRKHFGGLKAVDGVSLGIKEGSITGLVGPNGSGKTTLFNVISGIFRPDAGEVYFNNKQITGLPPYEIFRLGLVRSHQFPRLFQKMTVLDNMVISARRQIGDSLLYATFRRRKWYSQEAEIMSKAMEILRFLDLAHLRDSYPSQISGGQLKLLEIGRALMSDPQLLLLDEPTAGVNPVLAKKIYEKIEELRRKQCLTFFIIEHRFELMLDYADELFVMNKGKVICEGKPSEVAKDSMVQRIYIGAA